MTPARALVSVLALLALVPSLPALAQEQAPPDRAALEAALSAQLSGATLVGVFTDDTAPDEAPQADRYTLGEVEKLEDGRWRFEARIQYGERDFTVPIVLPLEWAGDTPVITMTDQKVMGAAFTARVLFYGDEYVGLWKGPGHGGTMWGSIERATSDEDGDVEEIDEEIDEEDDDGGAPAPAALPAAFHPSPEAAQDEPYVHWPSYRGRDARGVAEGFTTVVEWDLEEGENVRWRVPVAGLAHSSPVLWGDRIYLTTAVRASGEAELRVGLYGDIAPVADESAHELRVLCFDKKTGKVLWDKLAWEGVPAIKRHPKGSHAASTPATDGRHVVAFFGTEGLYCYTADGELVWKKDLGTLDSGFYMVPDAQWGFASSPLIHGDKVIVQCDVQKGSFLAALDLKSGEELWRTARDEVPTWSTPTVDVREGRSQVICNGWKHIGGYDLGSGKELWKLVGGGDIPVPTPVVAQDLVFITNAHGMMAPVYAIDTMAEGEIAMDHEGVAWSQRRGGNYMQTPVVVEDLLYLCSDNGVLTCKEALTGEELFRERLGSGNSGFTASCVAADGKLYATSEEGEIVVVPSGGFFEVLGRNQMGEECMATPAVSEGVLYWRTRGHLVAIGED